MTKTVVKNIVLSLVAIALFSGLVWFGLLIRKMYVAIVYTQAHQAVVENFISQYMGDQVKDFNSKMAKESK